MQYATVIEDFRKALEAALAQTSHKMNVPFTLADDKDVAQPPNYLAMEISTSEPFSADLLRVVVRQVESPLRGEESTLHVTYDSAGGRYRRPIEVSGVGLRQPPSAERNARSQRAQVEKLMARLQTRYEVFVDMCNSAAVEEQAAKANAEQWKADFTVDGKAVIPEKFACASSPGLYSVNTDISQALLCNKWKREEVLELAMLLKSVRFQMVNDGRLPKP
jgi:hypothetical protein